MKPSTLQKFRAHIVDGPGGCRLWTSKIGRGGYGHFCYRKDGRNIYALVHRLVWELERGPIPGGLTIDHLCRVRHCVNTAHMETVDIRTNTLRGDAVTAQNARKEVCLNGHPLVGANLYVRANGMRQCVACQRQRVREWRARQRQRVIP